jgi:tetratricopeptide (TPR) repeat protein
MLATHAAPAGAGHVSKGGRVRSWAFAAPRGVWRRRRRRFAALVLAFAAAALVWSEPGLRGRHHLRAAREESRRYHTPQAIRHLRVCRDLWPHDPEVMLLAARAARRAGVYADSERLLALYARERGDDAASAFERLLLDAECRQDRVVEQCWKYVEEGRPDADLLLEALTRGYLRQFRLGMARRCLDRWKGLQPDNPQMLYLEGLFHLDYAHAVAPAVESYARAVELDPEHEDARLGLAVALLTGKEFARAAEHLERVRQAQPDNARVRVGLAECRDALGDTAEAVRLVDEVLAGQPHLPAALSLRGQLAYQRGQWAEAEAWLREAVRRNPTDNRARYTLVLCLDQTGKAEEAREQRQQLRQLELDAARFNEIVTKEIALRPADPALHCELGRLLLRAGQREEGLRWLASALQIDPGYATARQALAEFQRQGNLGPGTGPAGSNGATSSFWQK